MKKTIENIKSNWLAYIIVFQPILDIISYFQSKFTGNSFSWIVRIVLLFFVFVIALLKSQNKKKLILYLLPWGIYFIVHVINLLRINQFSLILDVKYYILVFQTPILTILLIDYIKNTNYSLDKIRKALFYSFFIIVVSIFLSYLTKTYEHTYVDQGIIGWFSSANTASMILCALTPWALYLLSCHKNVLAYILCLGISFVILYTNATRSCYLTLLSSFLVMLFAIICSKNESKKLVKICFTFAFILLSIFAYNFSFTSNKETIANNVTKQNAEDIKNISESSTSDIPDFNNINTEDKKLISDILKTSYLYENLMNIHGEDSVIDIMKPYLSASALSDNRLSKVVNAKIEYNHSDTITKFLGIGYSRIALQELDMENDIQAIFYYYGYIGITLYLLFILVFIFKSIIYFLKCPSSIRDKEFIMLSFLILLLIVGGEYSGAFLRKSNANIYLSIYLLLLFFKTNIDNISKTEKIVDKKKIVFLLLHLGYGGIETATINTANALSDKYDVELVSFYNLKDNQVKYINKNIDIKYLYDEGPNREEFKDALKNKNILSISREAFKAMNILIKKRFLIKNEIITNNSFAIVSTRYDFNALLSKYGRKDVVKIAQEHHHHNNNKKYINILKNKYKNIDYLFALTESLKNDYESFLSKNKHTKIVVVPNMIDSTCNKKSDLSTKNIVSICRLHPGKKLTELIDIFSKLQDKSSKLYIIGDGEEKSILENQIKAMNLSDRVIMTGYLNKNQQIDYLLNSSVYAMTSESEGLPMVLLEAMCFGLPCIAYKTDSGVSDIIENNANGFVIDHRNQSLYIEKLDFLLSSIDLRKKMSNNCKKTVDYFSKENICKIWEDILNSSINK